MSKDNIFRNPRQTYFNLLTTDELDEIHYATLEVLERTGLHFRHPEALELFHGAGAHVENDLRVRIPSDLVKKALQTSPERVVLADRNQQRTICLENRKTYFGLGSDLQYTIDLETREHRISVLDDVAKSAKVADFLPEIDFIMSHGLASDIPHKMTEVAQFDTMIRNSTKPMILTSFSEMEVLEAMYDIACAVRGGEPDLRKNPYIIVYGQFISPFEHHKEGLERLLFCAEKRIPLIYIPTVMAGVSGPATLAGSLVVANAECLAGLVLHQLKSPGAPYIYGGCVQSFDMRAMLHPYGSPEWRLSDAALSQLSQRYQLPVFGTAGATDSKIVDEQAAIEASYSLLFTALTGTNIIHDVGYLESGLCGSLDFLVMCNDMVGLTRRILRGIRVDREAIAVDLIDKVGPGKHFTEEEHTYKNFKEEMWYPGLLDRKDFNVWKADGEITFQQRCIAEAKRILKEHEVEPVSDETSQELKNILSKMERKYLSAS